MRPERAAACGAALLLLVAGILRAEGALLAAALPLAAFAALGAFFRAPKLSLSAERILSARFIPAGGRVEVRVLVVNRGPRIECLLLTDALPRGCRVVEGESSWKGSLDAAGEALIRYAVEAPRGLHRFDALKARAEEPLAATLAEAVLACPLQLAAYPRRLALPDLAFGAGAARPFSGRSRAKRSGSGCDFGGTRDYAPGDPLRSLNWRAEALWDKAVVNVFEEERAIDAGIILDCRAEAYEDAAIFEAAASAALSLAEELLDRGDRVAFLSYGSTIAWTPPGSGREQRLRLRMAAARAALGSHAAFERFDNLPTRLFPPRSLVVLASPLLREDIAPLRSLRALGYAVAVLRPDPLPRHIPSRGTRHIPSRGTRHIPSRGQSGSLSRNAPREPEARFRDAGLLAGRVLALEGEVLLSRLLRAGIAVLDWDRSAPLASLSSRRGARP